MTVLQWQSRDLEELAAIIKDKSVALVGNASSLLTCHRPIDGHDVVIRMNNGPFVRDPDKRAGQRTDVLLVSNFSGKQYLAAAPHVVWMTPKKRETLSHKEVRAMYFYPVSWWAELEKKISARPSTGCMGIDLVSRLLGMGELFLYGFDFWRSPTTYTGVNRPGPHAPSLEEAFARTRVKPENIVT
jgi:Glycosyltransferase family 29 (sialyltransferase)